MEPLQDLTTKIIAQAEEAKKKMAQTQAECATMINEDITVKVLDALKEKTVQAQTQENELTEKFQTLKGEFGKAHKV
jgi:hypothetical protein